MNRKLYENVCYSQQIVQIPDDWKLKALCRGKPPSMFFPKQGQYQDVVRAKQFCLRCEVQQECLTANIDEDDGVYGGTSGRQRKEMRRAMKRAQRERLQIEDRPDSRKLTAQAEPWEQPPSQTWEEPEVEF